jgi:hypothetical protein
MKFQKLDLKLGKEKLAVSVKEDTKALKMKSIYIMAETTKEALNRGGKISEAKKLDYEKIKKVIEKDFKKIIKEGQKFRVNVLTDEGWRGGQFTNSDALDWYDPAKRYADADEIDEVYMIQIQFI